jgi:hypothetical protein
MTIARLAGSVNRQFSAWLLCLAVVASHQAGRLPWGWPVYAATALAVHPRYARRA